MNANLQEMWRKVGMPQPREFKKSLARKRLLDFALEVKPNYLVNWHHRLIAEKLEKVRTGEIKRLMISVQPRAGKSELVSRLFPAWALGVNPNEQIIGCSYNETKAQGFNMNVQRYIMSDAYGRIFPETKLNASGRGEERKNAHMFEIVGHRGMYIAAGAGGSITGEGGTIGIIDDPVKNDEDAKSEAKREKVWDWYTGTFLSRSEGLFSEGGDMRVILCMTRWHEDDLAGRILEHAAKHGGREWDVVTLPAVLDCEPTPGDPREEGEVLWPQKYTAQMMAEKKLDSGSEKWESLYQQRPQTQGGGMFKRDWWQRYKETPRLETVWTSWDMTFKAGKKSDYVVGQVWGRAQGNLYLLDQVRGQWEFTETVRQFLKLAGRYPQAMAHLVESAANGPAVISQLRDTVMGMIAIKVTDSKTARASAVTPIIESGNVYIPEQTPWVQGFIDEHAAFPKGKNDDQVDAMSQAIMHGKRSSIAIYEAAAAAGWS